MPSHSDNVSDQIWQPADKCPPLKAGEVHVWRASLYVSGDRLDVLAGHLDEGELAQAERFRFDEDRRRFLASHGYLREVLGSYLGVSPHDVRFTNDEHGKPTLAGASARNPIRFNMSHCKSTALYAVSLGREVGIDVEDIRPETADAAVARRFFAEAEAAALEALPQAERTAAFFACWTRKEAFLKARGLGLMAPLDAFEVSLLPDEPAAIKSTAFDPREASRWTLLSLCPGEGLAAALAVEGSGWTLRLYESP